MPPLPPVPNVIRTFIKGVVDNENIYNWGNVLYWLYSGGAPNASQIQSMLQLIASNWGSHISPLQPAPTKVTEITGVDLTSNTSAEFTLPVNIPGTRGDDSIPANAALLVNYPSPVRYRGGHPRTYLYVGGNADLEGAAKWASTFAPTVQVAWQAFLNGIVGQNVGPAVLSNHVTISYYSGRDPITHKPIRRAVPVVMPLQTSLATAVQEIASQRGRVGRKRR